jgi:phenylacetate-CoA ligase
LPIRGNPCDIQGVNLSDSNIPTARSAQQFFHLRTPLGSSWPKIPAPEVAQVWAAYAELERTQWLRPDEIAELQLSQLRTLLSHCYAFVPYYRRVMSEVGITERPIESLAELSRLPILTRAHYQEHSVELKAQSLPPGMAETWNGYTSGTNGVPLHVRKTDRDGLWWNAFFLRDLQWGGLDPRGRLASIRLLTTDREKLPRALEGGLSPYWTKVSGSLLESGPSYAMDIRQDPRRQLEWLREVNPHYLISLSSNLEYLAGLVEESGQRLPELRVIQAVGESLPASARRRIESGFGVPVRNLYSSMEGGYIASACPSGAGLHVHAENILAEVLDAEDRPCLPGQTGRLVFTTLHSFLCPFIRYDILDEVTLATERCPCGRGLPLWSAVDGRRHPLLHLPDGSRKSSMGITLGVRQVGGVHQFQIVQKAADLVLLRVVPSREWHPQNVQRLQRVVWDELGPSVRVEVEEKEWLERPGGGKLKIVSNELENRREAE